MMLIVGAILAMLAASAVLLGSITRHIGQAVTFAAMFAFIGALAVILVLSFVLDYRARCAFLQERPADVELPGSPSQPPLDDR